MDHFSAIKWITFRLTKTDREVILSQDGRYALSFNEFRIEDPYSDFPKHVYNGVIRLWDVATGEEIRSFSGHTDMVRAAAFSPDNRYFLSSFLDNTLRLWDVSAGTEIHSFSEVTDVIIVVAFSPDGRYALGGSTDRTLKIWEVVTGELVRSFSGLKDIPRAAVFSPDGDCILYGSHDGTLVLLDVPTGREVQSLSGHTWPPRLVAFSPDGRYVLASGAHDSDNTLRMWEVSTGRMVSSFYGHDGMIMSMAFSPDGRFIAAGQSDTINLWDVATGKLVDSFPESICSLQSVTFSPNGYHLVSGYSTANAFKGVEERRTLKIWDIATGEVVQSFSEHRDDVYSVAFSPDGRYVLSGGFGNIRLWEVATGKEVRSFSGHLNGLMSVAFSPDGDHAISHNHDGTIRLWDVSTGREVRCFSGYNGYSTVAFSPDGQWILSGSGNQTKLWSVETGQTVHSFSGHTDAVVSVAFSPDGRYALSCSRDHTIKLWSVETGELLLTYIYVGEVDWVITTPDGRFDGSPNGMKLMHYAKDNKSISLDALFDKFYTPSLMAQVLSGEELAPDAPDIRKGIEIPPLVRIVSPREGQTLRQRTVEVVVEAVDQGGGVEDIRLYHNGKRIGGEERGMKVIAEASKGVGRTFTVLLLSGTNTLRATAFSRDRTEAHPFEVTIEVKIVEATADLYIVAVGINTYKNRRYNLNYGVPDAEAVVASLSRRGERIFRDIRAQTVLNEEATRSGIEAALRWVEQESRPEDVFVLYYAGHGVMSEGSTQQPADFYLVPTDVTQIYGNDALLGKRAISATQLRDICQRIKARKQLVILDACQSGAVVDSFAMRGAAEEKAIAQLARSAGLVVLASTESAQFATEFRELGHGLFTYTLLQGIEGGADGSPRDFKVTVNELSGYIQDQIPELTKHHRGKPQYPMVYMRGQDFPIAIR